VLCVPSSRRLQAIMQPDLVKGEPFRQFSKSVITPGVKLSSLLCFTMQTLLGIVRRNLSHLKEAFTTRAGNVIFRPKLL